MVGHKESWERNLPLSALEFRDPFVGAWLPVTAIVAVQNETLYGAAVSAFASPFIDSVSEASERGLLMLARFPEEPCATSIFPRGGGNPPLVSC